MTTTKFYTYIQNNSGGNFVTSEKDGISEYVIIEALNAVQANEIALKIGIYFDGCESGDDCPCCGDRWYLMEETNKGDNTPSIYGETIEDIQKSYYRTNCFIHYLDGTIRKHEFKEN